MFFFGSKLAVTPLTETELQENVQGKDILIVGGTKGIGHALMESLARRGAKVTITGRTQPENLPSQVSFVKSDVTTLKASRDLVQKDLQGRKFDTVVFTVGIFAAPTLKRTSEGVEEDLAVSYLSRFIIVNELIKADALTGRKRVYIMGYPGEDMKPTDLDDINFEKTAYGAFGAHFNTVIFNEALVYELARRQPDLHVFGLNPGMIQTNIRDNYHGGSASFMGKAVEFLLGLTMPSAEKFSETVLMQLVASPELDSKTAVSYTKHGAVASIGKWMAEPSNKLKVWERSEELVTKVLSKN